jgi:hypothetical protein
MNLILITKKTVKNLISVEPSYLFHGTVWETLLKKTAVDFDPVMKITRADLNNSSNTSDKVG